MYFSSTSQPFSFPALHPVLTHLLSQKKENLVQCAFSIVLLQQPTQEKSSSVFVAFQAFFLFLFLLWLVFCSCVLILIKRKKFWRVRKQRKGSVIGQHSLS